MLYEKFLSQCWAGIQRLDQDAIAKLAANVKNFPKNAAKAKVAACRARSLFTLHTDFVFVLIRNSLRRVWPGPQKDNCGQCFESHDSGDRQNFVVDIGLLHQGCLHLPTSKSRSCI
eukprot:1013625-Rhodomonas_salina.1